MIRSRSTSPTPIMPRTSERLPIERSGTPDSCLSARTASRPPRTSRVLLQASGSARVFDTTIFVSSVIRVLPSSVAADEIGASAS